MVFRSIEGQERGRVISKGWKCLSEEWHGIVRRFLGVTVSFGHVKMEKIVVIGGEEIYMYLFLEAR